MFACLWFNQEKTNKQILTKFCTQWLYLPRSDIGLFLFRYYSPLQDDGLFSYVTTIINIK